MIVFTAGEAIFVAFTLEFPVTFGILTAVPTLALPTVVAEAALLPTVTAVPAVTLETVVVPETPFIEVVTSLDVAPG